jgi:phosphoribosylanthranilate isomerase
MRPEYKIKICGIQSVEIMDLCQELAVDFVGLNFSPRSKRQISEAQIKTLLQKRGSSNFPKVVFLFFENEEKEITHLTESYKPDRIQLIANDSYVSKNFFDDLYQKNILLPSFRIQKPITNLDLGYPNLDLMILDSFETGEGGGTGKKFPWEFVKDVDRNFLLAGGINESNVVQALTETKAIGIDVASGVETDGKKDPKKIKLLVENVRRL